MFPSKRQHILDTFSRISRENPDAPGIQIRLAAALALDMTEDHLIAWMGNSTYVRMRSEHDENVQFRRRLRQSSIHKPETST